MVLKYFTKNFNSRTVSSLIIIIMFSFLTPHPGRTDSQGGHNCSNKSKARGLCSEYHYHNSVSSSLALSNQKLKPEYKRKDWGDWKDKDGDCQDERAEILISSSMIPVTFKSEEQCVVISGKWYGAYTGKYYYEASDIDIDHLVPLKEAHISCGASWSKEKKSKFYNDHDNLLPVYNKTNSSKKDQDPSDWLPIAGFVCEYIQKWQAVKEKYNLTMDAKEKVRIEELKKNCIDKDKMPK